MKAWLTCVSIVVLGCAGCGGRESSVHGTVTLDGKPLDHGTVAFHPEHEGPTAYGTIAEDGTYELRTGATEGLAAGTYRVTAISLGPPPPPANWPAVKRAPAPGKPLTPVQYASASTIDLMAEIKPGRNKIDLELISRAAP